MILALIITFGSIAHPGVRTVSANPCTVTRINLGIGLTTQLIFDAEPRLTLFADKDHFLIQGTKEAPRSLAIIPLIRTNEIDSLVGGRRNQAPAVPISLIDSTFKTNLFVFFDHGQQLMFELRFVSKESADFAVHIQRKFNRNCVL